MTFFTKTIYALSCDQDGCVSTFPDGVDEYAGWTDKTTVTELADEEWWWTSPDGSHYCESHDPRCTERCGDQGGPYGVDTEGMCVVCSLEFHDGLL